MDHQRKLCSGNDQASRFETIMCLNLETHIDIIALIRTAKVLKNLLPPANYNLLPLPLLTNKIRDYHVNPCKGVIVRESF